ncbi:unnamed protein product [Rotaria sp. Silwood2]|nr:unnamed protein product [Rotaria sp. Silwood2]CAF3402443.1 unnamed protein product [Rotaria sp. Silwood2]CAF4478963.1 unnamed protein product [Rotaria sp. Silwood2]CAF4503707.1 unnamed protein product [Rotaria sp. Silwood2]
MTNQEKQADEILALQSIFDTKFRLLHDNTQYEVSIDFDLIQPFLLRCNDKTSIIHYLPPFSLIIHYHDEYPSDYPPSFLLSCFYFSKISLQHLCQKLDNYSFIKGEVCVYDWIELIRQEISNEQPILDTKIEEQIHDPRALNGYLAENVDQIYQYLINYNNEQEEKQFQNRLQTCLICTDSIPGIDCIRLHRCGHFYCQSCLNNYVQTTLNSGRFGEKLLCPQTQCQKALLPNEIKQIIQDDRLYKRYERLTLQHALELMNDIIWCPRCQSAVLTGSGDDNLAICDQCHFTFCKKCKELFHFQIMCPKDYVVEQLRLQREKEREIIRQQQEEERERIQQVQEKDRKRYAKQQEKAQAELARIEKQQKTADERSLSKQRYREIVLDLSKEDNLLEKILNAERLEALNTQPCPNCNVRIEKNGGCSHMHCLRCDHDFTWHTAEGPRDPQMTSLLYHSSTATPVESIKAKLAKPSEETIEKTPSDEHKEDSKLLINNRSFIGSAIVKRVKACPNTSCQKLNVKIGDDNWIVCNGCLKQYCFSCVEPINGVQHFHKKCDRYTPL